MNPIVFFAAGLPKGQPRPRAFAFHGKARVYDPGTAEGWKSSVAIAAKPFIPASPISFPASVTMTFVMPRPKGHYRTGKRASELRKGASLYHTAKPDCDNLAKGSLDALTTLGFFTDDALVAQLTITKLYAFGPRTGCRIEIKEADQLFAISSADTMGTL